jgi:hypothetical protein
VFNKIFAELASKRPRAQQLMIDAPVRSHAIVVRLLPKAMRKEKANSAAS